MCAPRGQQFIARQVGVSAVVVHILHVPTAADIEFMKDRIGAAIEFQWMDTGLLAQGVSPLAAAATGAYIHGRMADEWVRAGNAKRSLEASDLREILPGLISRLRPLRGS